MKSALDELQRKSRRRFHEGVMSAKKADALARMTNEEWQKWFDEWKDSHQK